MGARASVVLLTFNGEKYLRDVLNGIFAQETDFSYEVIVIDSGSSDATIDILREYPVQLHQIPNSDFNHGDTRNLGARLSSGEFVAFITQSAVPANKHWLQHLVTAFDINPLVAAVYGLHVPRQDCDPVTRRDITEFFKLHGPPDQPTVVFRRNGRDGEPEYPVDPHVAEFYSDVNSCLRKTVWEKIPYQPLDYAEDQAFGRDILANGYWKVYEPRAAVYHSHSYPPVKFFRRQFDEYHGLRMSIGYRQPGGIRHVIFDGGRGGVVDSKYILRLPKSPPAKAKWIGYAFLVNFLRRLAGYLAARDQLPAAVVRRISLEAQLKNTASRKLRRSRRRGKHMNMLLIQVGDITIDERRLASRYLRGNGIEIGASHMPIEVDHRCAHVRYVDRISVDELRERFPELANDQMVPVDVVCDVVNEGLTPFEDESLDFVIASHLLEHLPDPLGFLVECHRVLRDSGIVYLGVPDKEYTFDKHRDRTLLEHVIQDFRDHKDVIDEEHLVDYLVNAAGTQLPDDPGQRRAIFAAELDRSFHVHVWTWRDVMEILVWLNENTTASWDLLDLYLPKGIKNEMIFMLAKSHAPTEEAAIRFTCSAEQLIRREETMETLISAGQDLARTDSLSRVSLSRLDDLVTQAGNAPHATD